MADDAANGDKAPASSELASLAPSAPTPEVNLAQPSASDAAVPDAADAAVPDAAVPDAAVPDAAVPDAAVPDAAVPDAAVAAPFEGFPVARTEFAARERGLYRPVAEGRVWSPLRRALLLGVGLGAPCVVIALSLYFIVKGGAPHEELAAAGAPALPADAGNVAPLGEGPDEEAAAASPESASSAGLENAPIAVPGFEDEGSDEEPAPTKPAPPKHFATVQEAALGSCSTESVDGLSRQIIEQARCIKPNDFVALPKRPNLIMAPHVFPYLEVAARDHLLKALDAHSSQTMTINSALRTVAQQYLVSHWAATKICGVQLATRPGESNHEIGSALDIAEAAKWRPALEAQQFRWLGTSDRVHFDYKGDNTGPRTATDVLAFQKLWNRNHADDLVAENGQYGPPTEQRLKKSPPGGFALGSNCRPSARKR